MTLWPNEMEKGSSLRTVASLTSLVVMGAPFSSSSSLVRTLRPLKGRYALIRDLKKKRQGDELRRHRLCPLKSVSD